MVETMGIKAGYKQTEVGIIPMDWDVKKLTDLVDKFVNGGTPSTQIAEYWNGNIPWITGADILNQKVAVIRRYISKEAVKNSSTNIIEKGNLLLVSRTGVGKLSITPFDIAISQDFTGIYVKSSELDTVYLFRYFDFAQKELKTQNQGTSIQGITRETLSSIKIPVPPTKTEQTAIATALNDADALITQLEKLIAKKRAIKQGAMQELLDPMVNGELRMVNDFNSPLTTQHSPFLKEGWEMKKLGEVFEITAGGDYRKEFSSNTKDDYHIYPIYSNSLSNKGLYGYCTYFSNEPNCVTVTARGTIGYSCYRDHNFAAIGRLLVLKPKRSVDCFYFSEYINSKIEFVLEVTGVPQLTAPQISQYEVSFPKAKAEQSRIAKILSDMDAEIEALENKLNKYKMIKQGMMQNLLTGRIRLV